MTMSATGVYTSHIVHVKSLTSTLSSSKNLTAWNGGDDMVLAIAAENNNTIVVVHSVGALNMERWVDHPNVTAVSNLAIPSLS